MKPAVRWTTRYVAYATAHGRSCEAMLAADRADWPGGSMTGFLLWMDDALREWQGTTRLDVSRCSPCEAAAFEGWLLGRSFAIAEGINGAVRSSRATTRRVAV